MEAPKDFPGELAAAPASSPELASSIHEMHSAMYLMGNVPAKMLTVLALTAFPEESYVTRRELQRRFTALCDGEDAESWVPTSSALFQYCKTLVPAKLVEFGLVPSGRKADTKSGRQTEAMRLTQRGRLIGPVVAGALLSLELQTLKSDQSEDEQRLPLQTAMGGVRYSRGRILGTSTRLNIYDALLKRPEGMAVTELRTEVGLSYANLAVVVRELCKAGILASQTDHENRTFSLPEKVSDLQGRAWASPELATVIMAAAALQAEGVVQTTAKDILDRAVRMRSDLARDSMGRLFTKWLQSPPNRRLVGEVRLSSNPYTPTRIFIPDKSKAYLKELLQIRRLLVEDSTEAEAFRQTAQRQAETIISSPREIAYLLGQPKHNTSSMDERGAYDWAHDLALLIPSEGIDEIELYRKVLDKYGKGLVYGEFRERLNYLPDIAVGENAARTATFVSVVVRTFSKSWGQGAACRNEDPELFFPLTNSGRLNAAAVQQANEAKAICKNCPVKLPCLKTALDQDEAEAIRGGIWFKFKSQELPAAMIQLVHRMVRIR